MSIFLPNGIGDYPTGDSLAYIEPLQVGGNVWYVDSVSGSDAVSPRGQDAARPLATLAQAITNAANGDIIVLLNQNGEALTSAVTINKSVAIVGSTAPSATTGSSYSRTGGASVNLFDITAADVQLRGLQLAATDTSAVATARIAVSGARFRMVGCYVASGAYDTGPALSLASGADGAEIRNCTFISTSTTTQPESAIKSGAAIAGLQIFNTTISGGTVGYSNYYAADFSAAAVTHVEIEGLSLLLGADMKLHASSTGWVQVELASGGSRVDW